MSVLQDQFMVMHTVILPSPFGYRLDFSMPSETVPKQPLLTDAVPFSIITHSPMPRSNQDCACLLWHNTVNQKHYSAQHILSKQLPKNRRMIWKLKIREMRVPAVNRLKQRNLQLIRPQAMAQTAAISTSGHPKIESVCNRREVPGRPGHKIVKIMFFTSSASLKTTQQQIRLRTLLKPTSNFVHFCCSRSIGFFR